eukprot:jgi/Tetstr1/454147/TSEL_041066.t1
MGSKNLRARGARTRDEYRRQYFEGLYDWGAVPDEVRQRAVRLAGVARARCRRAGFLALAEMRWRMTLSGRGAENGWAHTVGDVMVIPLRALESRADGDVVQLFIHEAVHVAQRKDVQGAMRLVTGAWGFVPAAEEDLAAVRSMGESRVNPDTDGIVYELDGRVCHPVFHGTPTTLADIKLRPHAHHPRFLGRADNHEHPFEIMAELVAAEAASA